LNITADPKGAGVGSNVAVGEGIEVGIGVTVGEGFGVVDGGIGEGEPPLTTLQASAMMDKNKHKYKNGE